MNRIRQHLIAYYLSPARQARLRARAERKRKHRGSPHIAEFFFQEDDPYSYLAAQVLPQLEAKYQIQIKIWRAEPPEPAFAPMAKALADYAARDAALLAKKAGLDWPYHARFTGLPDGTGRRKALGHYQGAMFYYGGEWYWGIDRLHFLEGRLKALGAAKKADAPPIFMPPRPLQRTIQIAALVDSAAMPTLDFYLSLRSPYTYLAAGQVFELVRAYGVRMNLKPVLPMVMRALPVPKAKRLYIAKDAARQAERLGLPFGNIADPVGQGVERGMAVLALAMGQGKGEAFVCAFLRGVWGLGLDAATDKGLQAICSAGGLDWAQAKRELGNESWRQMAAANQKDLLSLGLWGVPSFALDGQTYWGEDRLWALEDQLQALRKNQ